MVVASNNSGDGNNGLYNNNNKFIENNKVSSLSSSTVIAAAAAANISNVNSSFQNGIITATSSSLSSSSPSLQQHSQPTMPIAGQQSQINSIALAAAVRTENRNNVAPAAVAPILPILPTAIAPPARPAPPAPLGAFISNESIDEGVTLMAKFQHGSLASTVAATSISSTRQQQQQLNNKTVKVICMSYCPIGGHFATGSDDGIGRIWSDYDDVRIDIQDDVLREEVPKDCSFFNDSRFCMTNNGGGLDENVFHAPLLNGSDIGMYICVFVTGKNLISLSKNYISSTLFKTKF